MAALLASPEELAGITTVATARAWAGLSEAAWEAMEEQLGEMPSLRVLVSIAPADLATAAAAARAVVTPAAADQPEVRADLTLVQRAQVGLMWRVARQKLALPDVDPMAPTPVGPPAAGPAPAPGGAAGAGALVPVTSPKDPRKIKMNAVLDQTDESEIAPLTTEEHREFWQTLQVRKGGEIRPDTEPTDDQIAAIKMRVVELKLSPYADFALFTNFHLRFLKGLKFTNHVLQADGTWRTVEVPGPPDWDAWYSSWRVFENTLLGLSVTTLGVTGGRPVVTQASLDMYRDAFRDIVKAYPEVWHLCVVAEDRCRAEHFPRIKRRAEDRHLHGLLPGFNPTTPWDYVFREAADDRKYWDEFVREPALRFMASGSKRKGAPTGSATGEVQVEAEQPPKKKTKTKKKQQQPPPPPQQPPAGDWNRKGKRADKGGGGKGHPMKVTREGKPICYAWNNGGCEQVCPKGFAHVCQMCLGSHRRANHGKNGSKGDKGSK